MIDLGMVSPGETLDIPFATYDSNDPSASVTCTGLAVTDIEIYKDGSLTQRASDAGYAVDTDLDTIVGVHSIQIDLADNTTAGFFAAGSKYVVVVSSITVDGAVISFVAARFKIGYRAAVLNTTIATLASQTSFTLTKGPAEADALVGMWCIIHDVASEVQLGQAIISAYDVTTKTVTLVAGTTFTAAATDNISIMGPMPLQPSVVGADQVVQTGDSFARIGASGVGLSNISLPATGLDAILKTSTFALAIADAIWDEVLTGATHNVVNSAGRRLRQIQEAGGYSGGFIYVDTVNGTAGTTSFENGVETKPVDSMADANTLAAALGISQFRIAPGSIITLAAAQNNQSFEGSDGWTLALGGQDIAGSAFRGATVSGIAAGIGTTQKFIDCLMGASSHIKGTHFITCGIGSGTQTIVEAGDLFWDRCHSAVAGMGVSTLDFGTAIGTTNVNIRNHSGGWQFEAMGNTGTDTASLEGRGQLVEGTCAGGTVKFAGTFSTSGITNITIIQLARIAPDLVNAECETAISDYFGVAGASLTDLGGMSTGMKAEVLAEVNAALDTAIAELAVALPTATPTIRTALMLSYMQLRNKFLTQTSGVDALELYNDAGVKIASKPFADDAADYTESKMVSG